MAVHTGRRQTKFPYIQRFTLPNENFEYSYLQIYWSQMPVLS